MPEVSVMNKNLKPGAFVCLVLIFVFVMGLYPPAILAAGENPSEETVEEITPSELYARCAVLMDADSGRILFSKNGREEAPMASTTKIMTCILALENGDPKDRVTASADAAAQPEVRLGMREGDVFYLQDLLYSLMLESHNDSAVAVAEYIGGSVEGFASMMNEKAADIGCASTYFITPNGLDAEDKNGIHHTTACDLARIMRYCILESPQKDTFLEITRTESHTFTDTAGSSSYTCANHNAFLKMMDGALTGKTGFTSDAGYCYVGALRSNGKTFIVSLLACGWPNNKGYKWADTRKLMEYGLENYEYRTISPNISAEALPVENGYLGGFPSSDSVVVPLNVDGENVSVLLKKDETVEETLDLPERLTAPLEKGSNLGTVVYSVNGKTVASFQITAAYSVLPRTFSVCMNYMKEQFFF